MQKTCKTEDINEADAYTPYRKGMIEFGILDALQEFINHIIVNLNNCFMLQWFFEQCINNQKFSRAHCLSPRNTQLQKYALFRPNFMTRK